MNILMWDGVAPNQYTLSSLITGGLGGTEACVLRISNRLQQDGYRVTIAQRLRTEAYAEPNGLQYEPITGEFNPDVVFTLRDAGYYVNNKAKWPNAKHYLWMHDVVAGPYREHIIGNLLDHPEVHFICVSDFHKTNIIDATRPLQDKTKVRVTRIYPPLADHAVKTSTEYDKNKLIFTSSPHKGLDYVVKLFKYARNMDKNLRLYVSNPGYFPTADLKEEGIHVLGSLAHPQVLNEVRTSLCLFYPQISFPETFGLVYAEANAVGTPVIAHPQGAAREALSHPAELMDCRDYVKVIDRVLAWKSGERPIVRGKKDFQMSTVIAEWKALIE